MEFTQPTLRIFTMVAGALVLGSYVFGLSRFDDVKQFWGGVSSSMQNFIVPFMFVAAAGFITFGWITLWQMSPETLASLRWPWGESDGAGGSRLFWSLALFLIPSIFWLEATILHVNSPQSWTPALTIFVLFLVAVGTVMLILLSLSARSDGVANANWMLAGAIAITIQCAINDLIIWSWKFPWRG